MTVWILSYSKGKRMGEKDRHGFREEGLSKWYYKEKHKEKQRKIHLK